MEHIQQEVKEKIAVVKALPWRRWGVYAFIGLFVVAGLIFGYNRLFPKPPIVPVPVILPEAPQAVKVEKVYIKGPVRWRVYKKEELAQKVPLSPQNVGNPKVEYTATSLIPASPYGGIASSFTNVSTGISDIDYTPSKRPLFGFGGRTTLGVLGGVSTKGNVAVLYVGQPVARIGFVEIGVAAGGGVIGADGVLGGVVNISGEF